MLTVDGIHFAFSLPLQEQRMPLTLQVLWVNVISSTSSTQEHVEVTLSDGVYFSVMIFLQQLHTVGKQLSIGEFIFIPDGTHVVTTNLIGIDTESSCEDCKATPCEWQLYGKTIYDAVMVSIVNCSPLDISTRNKSWRFAAYQMYTHAKHGDLGKGNWTPIPSCVVRYIRKKNPDSNEIYVGFIGKDD